MDEERLAALRIVNSDEERPLRVLGLAETWPIGASADFTVLSLEMWTSHFAIRWAFFSDTASDDVDRRLQGHTLFWQVEDNLGGSYTGGDFGGGGGSSLRWGCTSMFVPAIDQNATSLHVTISSPVDGEPFEVVIPL